MASPSGSEDVFWTWWSRGADSVGILTALIVAGAALYWWKKRQLVGYMEPHEVFIARRLLMLSGKTGSTTLTFGMLMKSLEKEVNRENVNAVSKALDRLAEKDFISIWVSHKAGISNSDEIRLKCLLYFGKPKLTEFFDRYSSLIGHGER